MSQSLTWWRGLVVASIVLCIVFAVGASGQDKRSGSVFATVDFQKISNEYKAKQAVETDLANMQARFQGRLTRRAEMPCLSEEEHVQLDALREKESTTQTAEDKKKIADFETKGGKLSEELQSLRQKKDLTDAEKKRLQELEAALVRTQQRYAALKDELEGKIREYGVSKSEALMKEIRAAIAKVAEQRGIAIVFNSEVALYAGVDITQPVLGELNKK
jgi:Skp family chaperone for outer membrane proteins